MTGPDMPFRPAAHRPRHGPAQEAVDIQPRRVSRRRRPAGHHANRRIWGALAASGVLVALTAAALAWWTEPAPDAQPEAVIRADLARQGLGAIGVTAEGRHVHLAGVLPPDVPADFAVALARGATCTSFGISRPCADRVTARLAPAPRSATSPSAAANPP